MIEHNVVVVGGVEYNAVKGDECDGCALINLKECVEVDCHEDDRADRNSAIFKRHYRPKCNELPIKVIEL